MYHCYCRPVSTPSGLAPLHRDDVTHLIVRSTSLPATATTFSFVMHSLLGLALVALSLFALAAAAPTAPPNAHPIATWQGHYPNAVASSTYLHGSIFASVRNDRGIAHQILRVNRTSARVERVYSLAPEVNIQFIWASNTSLWTFGVNETSKRNGLMLRVDLDSGEAGVPRNARWMDGLDATGAVAIIGEKNGASTYNTTTWQRLTTYDGGVTDLQAGGVAIHPTNGHVFIVDVGSRALLDIAPNNTLARRLAFSRLSPPFAWLTTDEQGRYIYALSSQVEGFVFEQLDLLTGKAGFVSLLNNQEHVPWAQFAATANDTGEMGKMWVADTITSSLLRVRQEGVTVVPLSPHPLLTYATDVAVSADGSSVYVSRSFSLPVARLNGTTGTLIAFFTSTTARCICGSSHSHSMARTTCTCRSATRACSCTTRRVCSCGTSPSLTAPSTSPPSPRRPTVARCISSTPTSPTCCR